MSRIKLYFIIVAIVIGSLLVLMAGGFIGQDDSSTPNGGTITTSHHSNVTLIVTGDRSNVTYNNGYRAINTQGPFRIKLPLRDGRNYTVSTFNVKPGDSVCTLLIGSKEVAVSKALGQNNFAVCAIVQDKSTHQWIATTG